MSLQKDLEHNFDPSDVDGAMQLAYAALELAARVQKALEANDRNQLLGRDQANQLAASISRVGQRLHLLNYMASAAEVQEFRKLLTA